MKKIDHKLLSNYKLSEEEEQKFKEFALENLKVKEVSKFTRYVVSPYAIILHSLLIVAFFIFALVAVEVSLNTMPILAVVAVLFFGLCSLVPLIFICIGAKRRKRILKNSMKDIDLMSIIKKWFSFYSIKDDKVYEGNLHELRDQIDNFRLAPKDAGISKYSPVIYIEHDGIKTGLVNVVWHWERSIYDTEGNRIWKSYKLNQFYSVTQGFNKSWSSFSFDIAKKGSLFKKKRESLENEEFNRMFDYKYDDELKIRKVLTPRVQERLVNETNINSLTYHFKNSQLVTTMKSSTIDFKFTPFEVNINNSKATPKSIQRTFCKDLIYDFNGIMEILGHNHMLYTLYKNIN